MSYIFVVVQEASAGNVFLKMSQQSLAQDRRGRRAVTGTATRRTFSARKRRGTNDSLSERIIAFHVINLNRPPNEYSVDKSEPFLSPASRLWSRSIFNYVRMKAARGKVAIAIAKIEMVVFWCDKKKLEFIDCACPDQGKMEDTIPSREMFFVAKIARSSDCCEAWIVCGFRFCDTDISGFFNHCFCPKQPEA